MPNIPDLTISEREIRRLYILVSMRQALQCVMYWNADVQVYSRSASTSIAAIVTVDGNQVIRSEVSSRNYVFEAVNYYMTDVRL